MFTLHPSARTQTLPHPPFPARWKQKLLRGLLMLQSDTNGDKEPLLPSVCLLPTLTQMGAIVFRSPPSPQAPSPRDLYIHPGFLRGENSPSFLLLVPRPPSYQSYHLLRTTLRPQPRSLTGKQWSARGIGRTARRHRSARAFCSAPTHPPPPPQTAFMMGFPSAARTKSGAVLPSIVQCCGSERTEENLSTRPTCAGSEGSKVLRGSRG